MFGLLDQDGDCQVCLWQVISRWTPSTSHSWSETRCWCVWTVSTNSPSPDVHIYALLGLSDALTAPHLCRKPEDCEPPGEAEVQQEAGVRAQL